MKQVDDHNYILLILSVTMLTIGIIIRYIIGKRRFNRRGVAGLQSFKSFNQSLIMPFIERILYIIATLMILSGLFFYFLM